VKDDNVETVEFRPLTLWRGWVGCPHQRQLDFPSVQVLAAMEVYEPLLIEDCELCEDQALELKPEWEYE